MSPQLVALQEQVARNTVVIASAVTLLQGLSAIIVQLKNDPVALQALADQLTVNATTLSEAVTANTPATP